MARLCCLEFGSGGSGDGCGCLESLVIIAQRHPTQRTKQIACSRVLLEKLVVIQLVKKFPTFNGTWRFITVFAKARHWSLSWGRCILSTTSHRFPNIHSNVIFPSSHRSLPFRVSNQNFVCTSHLSCACCEKLMFPQLVNENVSKCTSNMFFSILINFCNL
jgi:hypothetical protein